MKKNMNIIIIFSVMQCRHCACDVRKYRRHVRQTQAGQALDHVTRALITLHFKSVEKSKHMNTRSSYFRHRLSRRCTNFSCGMINRSQIKQMCRQPNFNYSNLGSWRIIAVLKTY